VQCAWIDSMDGSIMWKQYVAESDPANHVYMNQPEIAQLGENLFLVSVTESNGAGKKAGNQKGASLVRLYVIEASDAGMQIKAMQKGAGKYSTHVALCGGQYGEDLGEGKNMPHAFLFEASITGVGASSVTPFAWNNALKSIEERKSWALSPSGDSGYLANIYGANPNDQGREHMRCLGDVPNPAYGVEGALFSNAKTLLVMPHSGRLSGDIKNSLIQSIIPGLTNAPLEPEDPEPNPSTGSGMNEPGGEDPAGEPGAAPGEPGFGSANGGCAMAPGSQSGIAGLLALAGLGMVARRRRQKEV
jgi:MYXO-CTERM domain-containing protein